MPDTAQHLNEKAKEILSTNDFTPDQLRSIDSSNNADLLYYGLRVKPGQHFGQYLQTQNGIVPTTIYNPSRSDPRVEAVKGEAVYAPKKETKHVDELQTQLNNTQGELIELKEQMKKFMTKQPVQQVEAAPGELDALKAELKKYQDKERMANARAARGKTKKGNDTPAA